MDRPPPEEVDIWSTPAWVERAQVLCNSFEHWLHRPLVNRTGRATEDARLLWEAPFVVVAHGSQPDPILNYGNRVALALWQMDIETFCATPSRLTAEPMHRDERARMLERTTRDGFIDDYRGIRIASTGRRFLINQAIVWNIFDFRGEHIGQAATFSHWEFL